MSALKFTPVDQNLLQASKFSMTFTRLPYVQFFLQRINIPGISTNPAYQQTPFIDVPVEPDKMTYEKLTMTFLVDEPIWSWTSINDWIKGMTFPDNFQQYKQLTMQQRIQMQSNKPQYSDGTLTVMTNKNNPIMQVLFEDLFPISLTSVDLGVAITATEVVVATAEFAFKGYQINRTM